MTCRKPSTCSSNRLEAAETDYFHAELSKLRLHRGTVNVAAERGGESPNSPSLYGHYAGRDRNHVTVAAGNESSSHDEGMGIGEDVE